MKKVIKIYLFSFIVIVCGIFVIFLIDIFPSYLVKKDSELRVKNCLNKNNLDCLIHIQHYSGDEENLYRGFYFSYKSALLHNDKHSQINMLQFIEDIERNNSGLNIVSNNKNSTSFYNYALDYFCKNNQEMNLMKDPEICKTNQLMYNNKNTFKK